MYQKKNSTISFTMSVSKKQHFFGPNLGFKIRVEYTTLIFFYNSFIFNFFVKTQLSFKLVLYHYVVAKNKQYYNMAGWRE